MRKTQDQKHGPVRIYTQAEREAYMASAQGKATADIAAKVSADYGHMRPHVALLTFEDKPQKHITIMAVSVEHAEDIVRERYPHALGVDCWQSTRNQ